MSETITLSTATATIYGTRAGARAYLGPTHAEWDVAADGDLSVDQRRALVKARRYIDSYTYLAAYDTFAERDAYDLGTGDGDMAFPFRAASYTLAAVLYGDPDAVTVSTGRKVLSISAGGDSVTYAGADKQYPMHPSILPMLSPYLSTAIDDAGFDAPDGQHGCTVNPFSLTGGVGGDCE